MAVQKSKRTPATRGNRRVHDKLKKPALSTDSTTGETHLRHRVSPDGFYRGEQVIAQPEIETETAGQSPSVVGGQARRSIRRDDSFHCTGSAIG